MNLKKIIILFAIIFPLFTQAQTSHPADLFFFYQNECPHCEQMKLFLAGITNTNNAVSVKSYEISSDKNNQALFMEMAKSYGTSADGVPMIFIGNKVVSGNYPAEVENAINNCLDMGCPSPVERLGYYKKTNAEENSLSSNLLKLRWVVIILALLFIFVAVFATRRKKEKV